MTFQCQAVFGQPGFLLPGDVQCKATLVYKPESFSVHGSVMGFMNILRVVVNYRKLRMTRAEYYQTMIN